MKRLPCTGHSAFELLFRLTLLYSLLMEFTKRRERDSDTVDGSLKPVRSSNILEEILRHF
jgi:hypothetical protein